MARLRLTGHAKIDFNGQAVTQKKGPICNRAFQIFQINLKHPLLIFTRFQQVINIT